MASRENLDFWLALEECRAEAKVVCDRIDEALSRLDAVAERQSKAQLSGLFEQVHALLERLQARHPQDHGLRDTLERLDRLGYPIRIADAKRMLERLVELKSSHPVPATDAPALRRIDSFPTPDGAKWEDVKITFTSEERVQVSIGVTMETRNYAELGFADNRGLRHRPNTGWALLKQLAATRGRIERPKGIKRGNWTAVEKQVQATRKRLCELFGIEGDPFKPFRHEGAYEARFRILLGPSFKS